MVTAACLSFFLGGFGADRFYLEYIGLGIAKLGIAKLLLGLVTGMGFKWCCCGNDEDDSKYTYKTHGTSLLGCVIGIWWIIDFILIVIGNLNDANGYPLASWSKNFPR